jgi:glycyl-tRNA synthetase (class II)
LDAFSDPMVDCKETKLRYCVDQLFASPIVLKSEITKTVTSFDVAIGYIERNVDGEEWKR